MIKLNVIEATETEYDVEMLPVALHHVLAHAPVFLSTHDDRVFAYSSGKYFESEDYDPDDPDNEDDEEEKLPSGIALTEATVGQPLIVLHTERPYYRSEVAQHLLSFGLRGERYKIYVVESV